MIFVCGIYRASIDYRICPLYSLHSMLSSLYSGERTNAGCFIYSTKSYLESPDTSWRKSEASRIL